MKFIPYLVTNLFLFISISLFAQSFPARLLPNVSDRPAFSLDEYIEEDTEYLQKDFFKSYTRYYFQNTLKKVAAVDALNLQFAYKSRFSKSSFDVFKHFKNKLTPKIENDLAFENDELDFSNLVVTNLGVCMGVTSTIRKFNMLAHFDPENKYKAKVPVRQIDEKAWIKYYQKLIDRVMANIPTIIPYFPDLEDLSTYGNFYTYLQRHSLDQWVFNNMGIGPGSQMLGSIKSKFSRYKGRELYRKLKRRLALHYNPKVFLSQPGGFSKKKRDDIYIHVMQVYKLSPVRADGSYTINLWDPNFPASHEYAKATVNVTAKGQAIFNDEDDPNTVLSMIDLYKWDDADIADILNNYKPFCQSYPEICNK